MEISVEQEINDLFKVTPEMANYIKANYSDACNEFVKAFGGMVAGFINEKSIIK